MPKCVFNPHRLLYSLTFLPPLLASGVRVKSVPSSSRAHLSTAHTKRLSVIDYFYLLPSFGISASSTRSEKRESLLPRYHPVIDVQHDYLEVQPDSSPREQFAVFRAIRKPDLLAVSMPDYVTDYNFFALYRLQDGKLKDVTHALLPMSVQSDRFLYELPRVGTTIRVYRFAMVRWRRHAFNLQWRGGRFIKIP